MLSVYISPQVPEYEAVLTTDAMFEVPSTAIDVEGDGAGETDGERHHAIAIFPRTSMFGLNLFMSGAQCSTVDAADDRDFPPV